MSSQQTVKAFRADQVGSLLRSADLLAARASFNEGRISKNELTRTEDKAILDALAVQKRSGIDVLTDGEYRRFIFSDAWAKVLAPWLENYDGEVRDQRPIRMLWKGAGETIATPPPQRRVITKRLEVDRVAHLTSNETPFLLQHAGGPCKVTLPSVTLGANTFWHSDVSAAAYASPTELIQDMIAILRREITDLVDQGIDYIQLDAVRYTTQFIDQAGRASMISSGVDINKALDDTIAIDNACLAGINRKSSIIGLHMCRGNNRSSWIAEGSYDAIAERVFSELNVDRLLLEYDDERSGGFEVLRYVPTDKIVVLGLISSKKPELESKEVLLRRIEEASRFLPLGNLALSPQCGFASSAPGNLLSLDDQERKLELVAEVAREVWS